MTKSATIRKLQSTLVDLPADDLRAVAKFVEFLQSATSGKHKATHIKQDWAGALSEFSAKYSSLDLQKLALPWREG